MLLSLLNWLTFAWLFALTLRSIHRIVKGSRNSVYWVIPILFMFCGLPMLLDEIVGRPSYDGFAGFAMATNDEITSVLYCLYMFIAPIFLLWFGKPVSKYGRTKDSVLSSQGDLRALNAPNFWNRLILWSLLMSPGAIAFFSPDPGQYLIFADTLRFSDFYQETHIGISLACNLSVLAGAFLLAASRPAIYGRWPSMKAVLVVVPWMVIAVWIHGKRSIAAIAGLLLILAFQYRGVLRGARAYLWTGAILFGVLSYSFYFQGYARRVDTTWYENARIDYGRDDKIKMTIFAELHPESIRVLEYRGQSLLFYLTAFIPREMWPDKPLPYAQYFTSAMLLAPPRLWGWGMTTSWLEEAIANFSWLGMLIGPLLIGGMCRVGDASPNDLVRILTPLVASLMLVVQASAFLPLLFLWLVLVLRERMRSSKFVVSGACK